MTPRKLDNGRWFDQIRVDGKRGSATGNTRREVVERINDLRTQLRGHANIGDRPTVNAIINHRIRTADWAPKTRYTYQHAATRIPAKLGNKRADTVTVADIEHTYRQMQDDGISAHAIRHVHGLLSQAFKEGRRLGVLASSPLDVAQRPRTRHPEVQPPTPATVQAIIDAASPAAKLALRIAATTGARRGEIVAIRWDNINLDRPSDQLTINESLTTASGEIETRPTKTGKSGWRNITLDAATVNALRTHRRTQLEEAVELAFDRPVYVFSNDVGTTPWRPDSLTHMFVKARKQAGVDGVKLHDLRHFVATQLLSSGVPVREVAYRLGHADTRTTESTYGHFIPGHDAAHADFMGGLLDNG